MTAGRNNQRRRRVILDEVAQSVDSAAVESAILPLEAAKPYSAAAKRRSQLKTTDMIPKRPLPLAIVVTSVLLMAVVLNVLAIGLGHWDALSESARQVFRFSGVGTLPNWFSSMLLVMTGMASLQIYGMRRHRCDDYNGHYQIWLFLAVLFAIGSVNCVVDFQTVFASLAKLAGFAGSSGFVVFLVAKMIAVTALVVRGILEIRASRAAFVAVIVVWIAYGSAIVAQIPDVQEQLVQNDELVVGNLVLFGNIAVFLTSVFYCRFVYLHANDLIRIEKVDVAEVANTESGQTEKEAAEIETSEGAVDGDEEQILSLDRETVAKTSRKKKPKKIQKRQRRAA